MSSVVYPCHRTRKKRGRVSDGERSADSMCKCHVLVHKQVVVLSCFAFMASRLWVASSSSSRNPRTHRRHRICFRWVRDSFSLSLFLILVYSYLLHKHNTRFSTRLSVSFDLCAPSGDGEGDGRCEGVGGEVFERVLQDQVGTALEF